MFYSENMPNIKAKKALVQERYKVTVEQKNRLDDIEKRLNIPKSALIRMAIDSFLPRIENYGYTEKGIKAGYLNGDY